MAKGQHLSRYQQGIVRKYYDHIDAAMLQKLQELVSDIYMAPGEVGGEKKLTRLWKSALAALEKTPADAARVQAAVGGRDVKALAEIVAQLSPGGKLAG